MPAHRRPNLPPIRPSKNASTMSSETSTDRGAATKFDGPKSGAAAADGLEPWQFFVLAALGCATAALFATRGQGVTAVVMLTLMMAATALAGMAVLRAIRPLVAPEDD